MNTLTREQKDDLYKEFKSLRDADQIAWTDLKRAFDIVRLPLAGYELRNLVSVKNWIAYDEFERAYVTAKEMKDTSKEIKNTFLKSSQDIKAFKVGKFDTDSHHSLSKAEERGFTQWINQRLADDTDCHDLLPIDPSVDGQLYERCKNGIILCKIVNIAQPNTIDSRCINKGLSLKNVFNLHENLSLVINSAAAIGCCVVNIGPDDILIGKRHIVLGLLWQLIRHGLVDSINIDSHHELLALLNEGEASEDMKNLSPEEILMRWVNFHLQQSGSGRCLTNFTSDLADSVIYAILIDSIVPSDRRHIIMSSSELLSSSNLHERAVNVLNNAQTLDVPVILGPEDIYLAGEKDVENRDRLNLAFLASLFKLFPSLQVRQQSGIQFESETLEEQTYRNWMNSTGVRPNVSHLYSDLRNGIILLQILDKLQPNCVNWPIVVQAFEPKKRLFQEQSNCNEVVTTARSIGIDMTNVSGEDIRNGNKVITLGVAFRFMHRHMSSMLNEAAGDYSRRLDDREILEWVNEQLGNAGTQPIGGFRDPSLASGIPVLQLLEYIKPNSTKTSVWQGGDGDDISRCQYAISCCRKAGARVYTLPEHLNSLNGKMISFLFAGLLTLYHNMKQHGDKKQARNNF